MTFYIDIQEKIVHYPSLGESAPFEPDGILLSAAYKNYLPLLPYPDYQKVLDDKDKSSISKILAKLGDKIFQLTVGPRILDKIPVGELIHFRLHAEKLIRIPWELICHNDNHLSFSHRILIEPKFAIRDNLRKSDYSTSDKVSLCSAMPWIDSLIDRPNLSSPPEYGVFPNLKKVGAQLIDSSEQERIVCDSVFSSNSFNTMFIRGGSTVFLNLLCDKDGCYFENAFHDSNYLNFGDISEKLSKASLNGLKLLILNLEPVGWKNSFVGEVYAKLLSDMPAFMIVFQGRPDANRLENYLTNLLKQIIKGFDIVKAHHNAIRQLRDSMLQSWDWIYPRLLVNTAKWPDGNPNMTLFDKSGIRAEKFASVRLGHDWQESRFKGSVKHLNSFVGTLAGTKSKLPCFAQARDGESVGQYVFKACSLYSGQTEKPIREVWLNEKTLKLFRDLKSFLSNKKGLDEATISKILFQRGRPDQPEPLLLWILEDSFVENVSSSDVIIPPDKFSFVAGKNAPKSLPFSSVLRTDVDHPIEYLGNLSFPEREDLEELLENFENPEIQLQTMAAGMLTGYTMKDTKAFRKARSYDELLDCFFSELPENSRLLNLIAYLFMLRGVVDYDFFTKIIGLNPEEDIRLLLKTGLAEYYRENNLIGLNDSLIRYLIKRDYPKEKTFYSAANFLHIRMTALRNETETCRNDISDALIAFSINSLGEPYGFMGCLGILDLLERSDLPENDDFPEPVEQPEDKIREVYKGLLVRLCADDSFSMAPHTLIRDNFPSIHKILGRDPNFRDYFENALKNKNNWMGVFELKLIAASEAADLSDNEMFSTHQNDMEAILYSRKDQPDYFYMKSELLALSLLMGKNAEDLFDEVGEAFDPDKKHAPSDHYRLWLLDGLLNHHAGENPTRSWKKALSMVEELHIKDILSAISMKTLLKVSRDIVDQSAWLQILTSCIRFFHDRKMKNSVAECIEIAGQLPAGDEEKIANLEELFVIFEGGEEYRHERRAMAHELGARYFQIGDKTRSGKYYEIAENLAAPSE